MRYILTISILIITVVFSSNSLASWTKVAENVNGTYYVDFERIRKRGDYINFLELVDLFKPDKDGDLSYNLYQKGDCKLFRFKGLSYSFHKEPMVGGDGITHNPKNPEWNYPTPNSSIENVLKTVCDHVK